MTAMPQDERMTEAEYLAMERESDFRHEFIDGYAIAMVGASPPHIRISGNLFVGIHSAFDKDRCEVFTADMRVRVSKTGNYYFPDVSAVCGKTVLDDEEPIGTLLNPTLIIEVLSPSTAVRDRVKKLYDYRKLESLQDYVLVTQTAPYIEIYSRQADGIWSYSDVEGLDASVTLPSVDVRLTLADVYARVEFEDKTDA